LARIEVPHWIRTGWDSALDSHRLGQTDRMTNRSLLVTKEWIWVTALVVVCSGVAWGLVTTIPFVNKLPEGTSTVTEYVVNQTVSRYGVPVVAFLFLAALMTVFGHNRGEGRSGLDFGAKLCSLGAATFSLWAVGVAISVGGEVST
jgi:hypothetical protein